MRRKRLLWQVYIPFLFIILVSLLAVAWYATSRVEKFYLGQTTVDLEARAKLVIRLLNGNIAGIESEQADALCKELGKLANTRITVILPSGRVIADSDTDPSAMENHSDRPEIVEALSGRIGQYHRFSPTIKERMLYVAVPVFADGKVVGVVRTSVTLSFIEETLRSIYLDIAIMGLVVALIGATVSFIVSRRIAKPLVEMEQGAAHFARGELARRVLVPSTVELASLAEALNEMAAQLDGRVRTVISQRNEIEAILSSMMEGVLAVDMDECIISLNNVAAIMLSVDTPNLQGRSVQEIVRNPELQRFVNDALRSATPIEKEIVLYGDGKRFVQAHGSILRDAGGKTIGAVIVLNDVTHIRRLEHVRSDFVANVSHELRTPITAIKGFVETLLDGAIRNPDEAERFLNIIARQTDRLNSIIEDLLSLTKIEQEKEATGITFQESKLKDIIQSAMQQCEPRAAARNVKIMMTGYEGIIAQVNPSLLEQAVVNLIDNAIKFSEPQSIVQVALQRSDTEITVSVRDTGCGIAPEHLSRIFERFYRVDKARSRNLGGTGLGLSIVKHIVQAHGGSVTVESAPGKGSTFTIHLPLNSSPVL